MKLTPAQERVLRELCAPGELALLNPGKNPYWFLLRSNLKRVSIHVKYFLSIGLCKSTKNAYLRSACEITPAGCALIKELDDAK